MALLPALSLLLAPLVADESHRPLSDAPKFVEEVEAFAKKLLGAVDAVPGFGFVVVVEDQVVLANGFGVADREKALKSDGDTLYYIASATKPFTALMASILDARGDFELGSPLSEHLDEGQLAPEFGADQILLKDLLCHTSGLENNAITFRLAYSGEHDPKTLWKLVGRSTKNKVGRGKFEYTNYGYNLLAIVLEHDLGKRWQDLLQDELFGPLGLTHTSAYVSVPKKKGYTLAAPYRPGPTGIDRIPLEKRDEQMQSAGGIVSSPKDLARWLRFQLHPGVLDGKTVVDPEIVRATQQEWIRIDGPDHPDGATACGGGWMIGALAGQRMLQHGGGYSGFRSTISFMPEARIGVAVLLNSEFAALGEAIRNWAYDWWLGRPAADPAERIPKLVESLRIGRADLAKSRAEIAARTWQLTKERAAYAGTYVNEMLGTLVVAAEGDALRVRLGLLETIAEPYPQKDAIRLELIPGSGRVAQFELDEKGRARKVRYDDEVFERRGD